MKQSVSYTCTCRMCSNLYVKLWFVSQIKDKSYMNILSFMPLAWNGIVKWIDYRVFLFLGMFWDKISGDCAPATKQIKKKLVFVLFRQTQNGICIHYECLCILILSIFRLFIVCFIFKIIPYCLLESDIFIAIQSKLSRYNLYCKSILITRYGWKIGISKWLQYISC